MIFWKLRMLDTSDALISWLCIVGAQSHSVETYWKHRKCEPVLVYSICSSLEGDTYEYMIDFHQACNNVSFVPDRCYFFLIFFGYIWCLDILLVEEAGTCFICFNIFPFLLCMLLAILDSESSETLIESLEIIPWTMGAIVIQIK